MNSDFFPLMPEKERPLIYGKRTGHPLVTLIDIKRDPNIFLTPTERHRIQSDINDIIDMRD